MSIAPFKLERYFARYEFSAPYLLSPSDCESLTLAELLNHADDESRMLWENLSLGYTESQGLPRLRQEICELYTKIQLENVLVMAPEEGIYISMRTLLSAGDEVVAMHPAYQSLQEVARSLGCRVIPWTVRLDEDGWRLDLDELKSMLSDRTRLLVINFPHNPTGFLPTWSELEEIVSAARLHGVTIFSDEMYRLLEYQPGQRLPAICDLYEKGITLSGMSKALALPGLRVGWLATRMPGMVERWLGYKDYTTICNSAPSEVLALMGLRNSEMIVRRNLEIIQGNLRLAEEFFEGRPSQFHWIAPQAGSVAFPQWVGEGSVEAFCERCVEQRGVMVVPGSMFDYPGGHFRVGLGRRNFGEALSRLD
ncbi:MAG TPA: aminotransferase class I/II-fold pyridoxal phosphate-dependent enzyme [Anaerolineaceae bacterium]